MLRVGKRNSARTASVNITSRREQCNPFGPTPLQSLPSFYGSLRPCAPHRNSCPCGFSHLDVSRGIGTTGSHVPYESLMRARAVLTPHTARSEIRSSFALVPGEWEAPVSASPNPLSTLQQRFPCARLPASCLPRSGLDVSATLTTIAEPSGRTVPGATIQPPLPRTSIPGGSAVAERLTFRLSERMMFAICRRQNLRMIRQRLVNGDEAFERRNTIRPTVASDAQANWEAEVTKVHAKTGQLDIERDFGESLILVFIAKRKFEVGV